MELNHYAYYNTSTGLVENVLLVEDAVASTLLWPEGYKIEVIPNGLHGEWSMCGIGWSYINGSFVEPPQPVQVAALNQPITVGAQSL